MNQLTHFPSINQVSEEIIHDRAVRLALAKQSHQYFFAIYFHRYITYEMAPFHKEMFDITEDDSIRLAVIVAFRGSGKSTIMTTSFPLWSIVGKQQKKFVVILSQTQAQARLHLTNIKREIESNELLRQDLGELEEQSDEWGATTLVIPKYGARIMIASTEQSIRGMRHHQYRPDLIIADDIEDLSSIRTREGRDKTYRWLTGEVIPAGDKETRIIIVGNLLHEDSVLMRLKQGITEGRLGGRSFAYPLLTDEGAIAWQGKFPNLGAIEWLKQATGDESAWSREYLLRIIAEQDRVIHREWLHFYDELPQPTRDWPLRYTETAIDLAISQNTTADYTAMVSGGIYGWGGNMRIYILPNPVNERLTFPQALDRAQELSCALGGGQPTKLLVEEVGYQTAFIQQLQIKGVTAEGYKPGGSDKRARLSLCTALIKEGYVIFPRQGCERLIEQLVGFGVEKHDDLVDAFAMLILHAISLNQKNISLPPMKSDGPKPILGNLMSRKF